MNRIELPASNCNNSRDAELLTAACRAAITAGSIIRQSYGKPHDIKMKGAINLVTETDLAAEAVILSSLAEDAPGIAIMAEESAATDLREQKGLVWVVDPLDGTTNFAHNFPVFNVSIGLLEDGKPLIGAVFDPMRDELFCSSRGIGTWLNGVKVQVSQTDFLIESLIGTGFPYDIHNSLDQVISQLQTLLPKVRDIRRAGAAALDLAYVACGRLDAFYEVQLNPWDVAAGWLLVEEAGGKVTDYRGEKYSAFKKETLASNESLHQRLVELL